MYSYANIVRSTLNQEKPEIMMQFLQAAPKYKENSTTVIGTDVEVVASVVMNSDAARGFAKSILDLLDDENGAWRNNKKASGRPGRFFAKRRITAVVSNSDTIPGSRKPAPGIPESGNACGVFLLRSNGPALTSGINVRL